MKDFLNHTLGRPETDFERAMHREIMTNEIRRMSLVLLLMVSVSIGLLSLRFLFDGEVILGDSGAERLNVGFIAIGLFLVYESAVLTFLHYLRRIEREPPAVARFGNAFLETSLPTVMIFIFAGIITPAEALFSPPSYAYFLFILISVLRLNFSLPFFTGCVAAVEYGLLVVYFSDELAVFPDVGLFQAAPAHLAKVLFFIFGGFVAGLISREIHRGFERSLKTVQERNEIRDIFGKHVSPEVVDRLLDQQSETDSETRHVCVMFLDIRDFTSFSEKRSPEEVVAYLNEVFDFMIDIINDNRGIVNKFLGDGFMAVFGAPLSDGVDSHNALAASRAIIDEVNRRSAAGEIPKTQIGIGLHAGDAVTGNVGSLSRREYTIIGDTVNVASRIEALNKQFQSQLLISETVRGAIQQGGHEMPRHEELEPLQVKGRAEPVQVFKVI